MAVDFGSGIFAELALPYPGSIVFASDPAFDGPNRTYEARVTAAIAYALANNKKYVLVNQPYNPSLVPSNAAAGLMVREGGPPQWADIRAYGAVGDGVTNDTAAFAAALTTITSPTSLTNTIWCPAGTYLADIILPADKRVRLLGDGVETTTIKTATGTALSGTFTHLTTGWSSVIADLTFDGNNLNTTLVNLTGTTKLLFSRVGLKNCLGTCLYLNGHYDGIFSDIFVKGPSTNAAAVIIDGTSGNEMDECLFYRLHIEPGTTDQIYLDLQGQAPNTIRLNDFFACKLAGDNINSHPNNIVLRVGANANDNSFFGGTVAYGYAFPQVQVSGNRNRFMTIPHIIGGALGNPTYAYEFTGSATDNLVLGAAGSATAYTAGAYHVGASTIRTRIAKNGLTGVTPIIVADTGHFQTDYEQPQARAGQTVANGGNTTPDPAKSKHHDIVANGSITINAPLNPMDGMELAITVLNNTGGAIVTTLNAAFQLAGVWVDPAPGKRRSVHTRYYGYLAKWLEQSRTAADV